ncbi:MULTISPECIES: cytochrome ubiquinol oxidase subunit I [unclassified Streptomyces]|uniref:cytochrome ubiquinol oxidase subunit I n=1 Tax=unclassified Streptomyces TaxID=2593676 RepID=UPI00365DF1D4
MDLALAFDTLARWQFGITTVYHFLFVPLTISLSTLVAVLQTAWVRTGNEKYLAATKFWGRLFLINIAMGVVTGIVQEFQFGMNWSDYSRFVGDVFGAPLAFEALIAFFFESTFIGLWIFGWDKLPKRIHLACIWAVSIGTILSAWFILAANSFMQHPVGYRMNEERGRAELTDFWLVLTQNTTLVVVYHTLSAAFLTGGTFMLGIAALHLRRGRHVPVMRTSMRLGMVTMLVAGVLVAFSGDSLGKVMVQQQPMKMAAAEALWDGQTSAPFSVFAIGDVSEGHNSVEWSIPGLLSFLAEGNFTAYVAGINDTETAEQAKYGPGDYKPDIPVAFWGFRFMMGFGMTSLAIGIVGLWLTRKKFFLDPGLRTGEDEVPHLAVTRSRTLGSLLTTWYWRAAVWTLAFPLIANSWGWIFTETGRQPWVVYGVLRTSDAVSPNVSHAEVIASMSAFTLLFAVLAVIEVKLLTQAVMAGPPELTPADLTSPRRVGGDDDQDPDRPMAFSY